MKIGVLGTGQVGQSLAKGFSKHGHEVKLGHRDPKASYADAAKFAEVVLLCTPWEGTENAIKLADPKNLAGKVVIDVTTRSNQRQRIRSRSPSDSMTRAASRCSAGCPKRAW